MVNRKYDGNGGNEQRIFIRDARIGWKAIIADANKHLSVGFTQFDYLETLGAFLSGQARRVLDNFVDKWDFTNEDHVNYEEAITREASRAVWRRYYKRQAIYDLCQVQPGAGVAVPVRPDELEDPIEEPQELERVLVHHPRDISSGICCLFGGFICLPATAPRDTPQTGRSV